jgi:maltose O-acetyltransferase
MSLVSNMGTDGLDSTPEPARRASWARLIWLNTIVGSPLVSPRTRKYLLRLGGVDVRGAGIWPHVRFISGVNVKIGDGAFVNSGVLFDARARIEIGDRVAIGPNAMFLTSSHQIGSSSFRAGERVFAPIVVEEGCWIGAGSIILAGVTIGRGCVIGAGAVVNRDCDADGLYLGMPAERKADLPAAPHSIPTDPLSQ